MGRILLYSLVVLGLSATARVAVSSGRTQPRGKPEAVLAADGAFRDGLFVGQFSAANRLANRPPVGRWSTQQDRAMFLAGYQRGYTSGR
jgi:hypothetical protein